MATKQKDISTEYAREILQWLHEDLGLTFSTIANAIEADRSTLHRWRTGKNTPSKSKYRKIMKLHTLRSLMENLFTDQEKRRRWLHLPLEESQGEPPLQYLEEGDISRLIEVLSTADSSAFS